MAGQLPYMCFIASLALYVAFFVWHFRLWASHEKHSTVMRSTATLLFTLVFFFSSIFLLDLVFGIDGTAFGYWVLCFIMGGLFSVTVKYSLFLMCKRIWPVDPAKKVSNLLSPRIISISGALNYTLFSLGIIVFTVLWWTTSSIITGPVPISLAILAIVIGLCGVINGTLSVVKKWKELRQG